MTFRKLFTGIALVAIAALLLVPSLDAGQMKKSAAASVTIVGAAVDTTTVFKIGHSNGLGFLVTWTDEDSIQVTVQTSLDGGTTWHNFAAAIIIDGGTTGPFFAHRALALDPLDGSGDVPSTLPIGTHARALITSAGADTCQAIQFSFSLSN